MYLNVFGYRSYSMTFILDILLRPASTHCRGQHGPAGFKHLNFEAPVLPVQLVM